MEKHLPDKFYLQDDIRVSLRSKIFREIVANLIVHREYTSGYAGTLIIYKDRVETRNPNNPHGNGLLLPDHFVPFAKNPLIARFFAQMGRVDELGSGILNVYKYLKVYSPRMKPQFIEEHLFKTVIPLETTFYQWDDATNIVVNEGLNEGLNSLLAAIIKNPGIKAKDLPALLENRPLKTIERQIKELVVQKFIERRGSRKTGGYWIISHPFT